MSCSAISARKSAAKEGNATAPAASNGGKRIPVESEQRSY